MGVMLGVKLTRLVAVVLRMEVVGVGDMGVVGGLFGEAGPVRGGRGMVVAGGVLVMLGGLSVMLDLLWMGHFRLC